MIHCESAERERKKTLKNPRFPVDILAEIVQSVWGVVNISVEQFKRSRERKCSNEKWYFSFDCEISQILILMLTTLIVFPLVHPASAMDCNLCENSEIFPFTLGATEKKCSIHQHEHDEGAGTIVIVRQDRRQPQRDIHFRLSRFSFSKINHSWSWESLGDNDRFSLSFFSGNNYPSSNKKPKNIGASSERHNNMNDVRCVSRRAASSVRVDTQQRGAERCDRRAREENDLKIALESRES